LSIAQGSNHFQGLKTVHLVAGCIPFDVITILGEEAQTLLVPVAHLPVLNMGCSKPKKELSQVVGGTCGSRGD